MRHGNFGPKKKMRQHGCRSAQLCQSYPKGNYIRYSAGLKAEMKPGAQPGMAVPQEHSRSVDLDGWTLGGGGDLGEAGSDGAGEGVEALRSGSGFAEGSDGFAGVPADADARIDFDFAEDGNAVGDGGFGAFAVAENVDGLVAMRAAEGAHVFDDAENFDIHLAKHFDGFADVGEGDRGRGGDDYCACDSDRLNKRELHVASAGREIDDEVIELAPLDAAEKFRDDAMQHGATPYHRFVAGIEQAHGDHLHAGDLHGNDALIGGGLGLLQGAKHDGHVGAVDVGVHEADFVAELDEREGEVDGDGGLADAAFAAGDSDEIFYAGDRMAFGLGHGCWWHKLVTRD